MPNQDGPTRPTENKVRWIRSAINEGRFIVCRGISGTDAEVLEAEIDALQSDLAKYRKSAESLAAKVSADATAYGQRIDRLESDLKAAREQLEALQRDYDHGLPKMIREAGIEAANETIAQLIKDNDAERQRREEAERALQDEAQLFRDGVEVLMNLESWRTLAKRRASEIDAYFAQKGRS